MRKLLLIILAWVVALFLSSLLYREKVKPITINFPTRQLDQESINEKKLNLVLFFSIKNCPPCLRVVDFLNNAPEGTRAFGVVPEKELLFLDEIRQTTGVKFPVYGSGKFKKYCPVYAPTLYGVGPNGTIYFMIPCTRMEKDFLPGYLSEFIRKAFYLLFGPERK
ncbi:MAG: hypothetical protein C0168_10940 [Candidatus Aminicenantes bacterium]|nr:MAG: hypothetical protein C0168_10940 [Candidatus Aminicenantes bacterium]